MKRRIMLGVYLLYLIRRLKSPFATEATLLVVFGLVLSVSVSVPSVISNMSQSGNFYRYLYIAYGHTNPMVQATLLLVGATLVLSLRNFGTILNLGRSSSVGRAAVS